MLRPGHCSRRGRGGVEASVELLCQGIEQEAGAGVVREGPVLAPYLRVLRKGGGSGAAREGSGQGTVRGRWGVHVSGARAGARHGGAVPQCRRCAQVITINTPSKTGRDERQGNMRLRGHTNKGFLYNGCGGGDMEGTTNSVHAKGTCRKKNPHRPATVERFCCWQ